MWYKYLGTWDITSYVKNDFFMHVRVLLTKEFDTCRKFDLLPVQNFVLYTADSSETAAGYTQQLYCCYDAAATTYPAADVG